MPSVAAVKAASDKPKPGASICNGARPICKGCPHALPHKCTPTPEFCVQGNEHSHRTVRVMCVAQDMAKLKRQRDEAIAAADAELEDAQADAVADHDRAVGEALDKYAAQLVTADLDAEENE